MPGISPVIALQRGEAMTAWSLVYEGYGPEQEGLRETLCALGNGYFVTRGAAPDSVADGIHYPGSYMAGGYNRLTTEIAGRKIENEDLVNLPNWLVLCVRDQDDRPISPDALEVLAYRQELDLEQGVLWRTLRLRDGKGRTTRWQERRLVSMADPHLAGLAVTITPENWAGRITVRSALDGTVINHGVARYRALSSRHLETVATEQAGHDTIVLQSRLSQSRLEIAQAARTCLHLDDRPIDPARRTEQLQDLVAQEIELDVRSGDRLLIEKIVAFHTSRDLAISEAGLAARCTVTEAPRFEALLASHSRCWRHLWEECGISLDCPEDTDTLRILRLHIFHLLQTVAWHTIDLDVGVPPRGWHGEAYRGHILWDELFILPLLNLRMPMLSRALLLYRYRRLPEARRLARAAGHRGAMFPWQSGSSGREESQRLHLNPVSGRWIPDNSNRQRHIGAAIAYNLWSYYEVTADHEFLYAYGAELLLEIARFWASAATYDETRDRYEIRGMMGPDEFHTAYPDADSETAGGLNNNAYTNVMAAWTLTRALDVLDILPDERCARLRQTMALNDDEIACWDAISRKLVVPFHEDGIISQFEGYEDLEELDWEALEPRYGDIQRLDRLLEAEGDTPNRYKASKQADVLMLFYLFSAEELEQLFERLGYAFDLEAIPRTVDYYLKRTSHGSTLSWMVHAWVLSRTDRARSFDLFCRALRADVSDIQGGTTSEGIHLGAMAGTVDLVQRCYLGIEPRANVLHLNPRLPDELHGVAIRIRYRRQTLDIKVDHFVLEVTSRRLTAMPVTVAYRGHVRVMAPGETCRFRLIQPHPAQNRAEHDRMKGDRRAAAPVQLGGSPECGEK
jgi:alpha,alpha-trehalase